MQCREMEWVEMTKWRNSSKSSRKEKSHDCVQYGAACATFVGENIFVGPLLLKHISSIVYS